MINGVEKMRGKASRLRIVLVILAALLLGTLSPASAQPLPSSDWFALAWVRDTDMLYWFNASGLQASLQRPVLPDEAADPQPQLRVSRDGRYLMVAALLSSGRYGLGIYQFDTGAFVKTHQAQPNEEIMLGGWLSSNPSSTRMAVSLANFSDMDNPAWRVIVFDLASGNAVAVLNHTNADLAALGPVPGGDGVFFPFVLYYELDTDTGSEAIHIHLVRWFTEGAESYPAFAWYPDGAPPGMSQTVFGSPYTRSDFDLLPTTGEALYAYVDPMQPTPVPMGPGPVNNAVYRGFMNPISSDSQVYSEASTFVYWPRWAAAGSVALFRTDDGSGDANWNVTTIGSGLKETIPPAVENARGTPNGYLKIFETGTITAVNTFGGGPEANVFSSPGGNPVDVIYVTPAGSAFSLTNVAPNSTVPSGGGSPGDPGGGVPGGGDPGGGSPGDTDETGSTDPATAGTCTGFATRLSIGGQARVIGVGDLRVRSTPYGTILTEVPPGGVLDVLGGPMCKDGFTWWQVRTSGGAIGWSAEGTGTTYYMEPVSGGGGGGGTQPDLYVSEFSLDPTTPTEGNSVNVRVGVYNQGGASVSGTSFRVEWYPGESYGSPACTWNLDSMSAGGGRILNCVYTGYPSPYSSINTKVVVDADNTITEGNEANNTYLQAVTVNASGGGGGGGGQPDLAVSEFSLDPVTPTQGDSVNVRVGVYNYGSLAASTSFQVAWYPGESYASPACTWNVDSMSAGGGRILTCTYSGYPSSYASINTKVVVDTGNTVAESNEANNSYTEAVTVNASGGGQPDLAVSEFSLDPATPVKDESVDVRIGVYNYGSARAEGTFRVEWYPGKNYPSPACSWNVNGMNASGGRILTCTYSGYPSTYSGIETMVKIDTTSVITESNEGNNTYLESVNVVASGGLVPIDPGIIVTIDPGILTLLKPDLYVSEFSLDPSTPTKEDPVNVRVGVYNKGQAAVSGTSFRIEWYPGKNYPNPACSWNLDSLAKNGGRILTCTYSGYPSTYSGIETMVEVDTNNTIDESDEGNNTYLQAINVNP